MLGNRKYVHDGFRPECLNVQQLEARCLHKLRIEKKVKKHRGRPKKVA
jgi:hypothetical protein